MIDLKIRVLLVSFMKTKYCNEIGEDFHRRIPDILVDLELPKTDNYIESMLN